MIKNYKLIIQYDGTKYNGWQKQKNTKNTIQEKFENILYKLLDKKIDVYASGRTDRGVHAKGQCINFKCEVDMENEELMKYINDYLPEDIRVLSLVEEEERFHSRLLAKSKTYEYVICAGVKADVFKRRYVYNIYDVPNISDMKKASELLVGTHDFLGFSSLGKTKKSTVRTINWIDIKKEDELIRIRINANGFLYNMVRIICGTLLEIGLGRLDSSVIDEVINTKDRQKAGCTLSPNGLTLLEVIY